MAAEKTLCVMGLFDGETNGRFERIKAKIAGSGCAVDEQPPHITFGIYSGIGRRAMVRWISGLAPEIKRTPLFFGQIGIFPESEVFFAAPGVTQELLDIHAKIHSRYDDHCLDKNCLYSLRGGKWIPHITLALPQSCAAHNILPILLNEFAPFSGKMTRILITEQEPLVDVRAFDLE